MMRLELLRSPALHTPQGSRPLSGREAALFAYLALEGATSRATLAALLWPQVEGRRARANLRQFLHRLGVASAVLQGPDPLLLAAGVALDLSDDDDDGELLPGVEVDGCSELNAWLELARTERRRDVIERLEREAERCELAGDHVGAMRREERLLEIDPYSEVRLRKAIAVCLRAGDRAAAVRLYEGARQRIEAELGVQLDGQLVELVERLSESAAGAGIEPLLAEAEALLGWRQGEALLRLDASLPVWRAAWLRAIEAAEAQVFAEAAEPLALYYEHRAGTTEGLELLMRARLSIEGLDDDGARLALGRLLVHSAWLRLRLGLPAHDEAARGVALLRARRDGRHLTQGLYAVGAARWYAGDRDGAREAWHEAEAGLQQSVHPGQAAHLHGNLAMAADALGDLGRARHHYQQALDLCDRSGDIAGSIAYLNNLGQLLVRSGEVAAAEALLDRGWRLAGSEDRHHLKPFLLDSRAAAAIAAGRLDEATRLLAEAEALAQALRERYLLADLAVTRTRLALAKGRPAVAEALGALKASWLLRYQPTVETALLLLAEALLAAGASDGAVPILATLVAEATPELKEEAARLLPPAAAGRPPALPLATLVPKLLGVAAA